MCVTEQTFERVDRRAAGLERSNKFVRARLTMKQTVYDEIVPVDQITNQQPANLYLMNRPDLISTFTKIELWKLTQYKRMVYLDADMVVLRAPNELLTMDTDFAAVPDVGWPDCFNSGLMVLNPNMGDYYSLLALARRGISFDGADQGLLNMHFTDWERLSFIYNCTPNANYQYVPAYKHFHSSINIIHFIGAEKPWQKGRDFAGDHGVYGELLARWWAVYDRHYRKPAPVNYNQSAYPQKKVQDYVRGEETTYIPSQPSGQPHDRRNSHGYQITQPHPESVPGIHVSAPHENQAAMERPFTDQPMLDERIDRHEVHPTSTIEQRRFSAPHTDWQPAIQPPPTNSKPEAANFPAQQYEMSASKQLFEPPTQYPEPPKDMWYDLPQTKPAPSAPPKAIFPWEERPIPKATRVFPRSREPSPPPPAEPEAIQSAGSTSHAPAISAAGTHEKQRRESLTRAITEAFEQPARQTSPSRHVFPWEARAPKPTRYFAPEYVPQSSPPNRRATIEDTKDLVFGLSEATTPKPPDNPWDAFAQQTNKWDEDPEIARFVESFNKPRRVPVQVVHTSQPSTPGAEPLPAKQRRISLKLTDFPTEVERPSLPVTPAPIRTSRSNYFGVSEERKAELPVAQGVPRQEEWVRQFITQYFPHHPNPILRDIQGVLHLTCQHCGQQNPIIKLDELQRRQSLIMSGSEDFMSHAKTPPKREMPESKSAEQVMEAAMRAMQVHPTRNKGPSKPILREPHFEVTTAEDNQLGDEGLVIAAHPGMTATGHKSPTRFNPIVLEGEAASERNTYSNEETYEIEEVDEKTTASHHHTMSFDYSTNSISPTQSRVDLQNASRDMPDSALKVALQESAQEAPEEVISPTTIA